MKTKSTTVRLAALKPRNPFAVLAKKRSAGSHQRVKRPKNEDQKDFVQRLREAGL